MKLGFESLCPLSPKKVYILKIAPDLETSVEVSNSERNVCNLYTLFL